jgi:hypothetical protein
MSEMQFSMSMPLDDGFLRRQCPSCSHEFKWHHGPTEERPADAEDLPFYYCPYCGNPADHDAWWTEAQREYAQQLAAGEGARLANDELQRMARQLRGGFVKMTVTPGPEPDPPAPLVEPADMVSVASPCHPWEPVKVLEDWTGPIHCLVCGEQFALS